MVTIGGCNVSGRPLYSLQLRPAAGRLGELLALRWQDVDLERHEILVKAENAKDVEDRVLPISTRLEAVLELAQYAPNGHGLPAEAFVFGDEVGRRVTTFKKAWQVTLLKASGYEPEWTKGRLTDARRQRIAEIDLHFHDLGTRPDRGGSKVGCRFTTCRSCSAMRTSSMRHGIDKLDHELRSVRLWHVVVRDEERSCNTRGDRIQATGYQIKIGDRCS